jgi:uncharacterized protein (TIGR00255 family)
VELTGVNRKQTDIAINLPGRLADLESDVRKQIAAAISRGRVNARVSIECHESGANTLNVDHQLAKQYVEAVRLIGEETGAETRITAADLFRAPGVFKIEESEYETGELLEPLTAAVAEALEALRIMQESEGSHLREDLETRLNTIAGERDGIQEAAPAVLQNYRTNLHSRLSESGLEIDLDDERLLREIGLFAERCDISEELTRIESHLVQFQRYFDGDEPCGRPLDFLCQELNREFNTIGSKANDAGIAQQIVVLKTELEKIREQVQNVQ